uniref:Type I neck protein n=1 Tax=Dulem virus 36 TaxID=3145754 RepID=A0AAU8AZA0_9CAUD
MASIRIDASEVIGFLETAETKAQKGIKAYAQQGAKKFENYAKLNKPWTNRTGHAQQRLVGYTETNPTNTRIYISHGVSYGKYLELAHEKRYAILFPTIKAKSQEVLEGYKELLRYLR